jgi:cardiolipin synthase
MKHYYRHWYGAHQLQLLQGGRQLFPAMVQALDDSVHEVHVETYIFHADSSGELIAQALIRAARRGVKVYLVMDGVGTPQLSPQWVDAFKAAGVQWHIFQPLGGLGYFLPSRWRRLHRKLCVVDNQVAFCGGINVLDDWVDPNHGALSAPRFDFAVKLTGPLVSSVHEVVTRFWWRYSASSRLRQADWSQAWQLLEEAVRQALSEKQPRDFAPMPVERGSIHAALLLRDNLNHRNQIERAYRKAIGEARHEIIIANAYFVPGRKLRKALIMAVQRGVRVRLLLLGKYEYFMQFHAMRMVYGMLLGAGIEIHEYSASFLHAKVAVIDGHWATVGSSNLDPLSLLLAREANVMVDNAHFASELREKLVHAIAHEGQRVETELYARRPWQQRWLDRMAYILMRLAVFLIGKRY